MPSEPADASAIARARAADEPHPQVKSLLELLESVDAPSIADCTPEEARELMSGMFARDSNIEVAHVEDQTIEGPAGEIPVRIYDSKPDESNPRPTICYIHGGG